MVVVRRDAVIANLAMLCAERLLNMAYGAVFVLNEEYDIFVFFFVLIAEVVKVNLDLVCGTVLISLRIWLFTSFLD